MTARLQLPADLAAKVAEGTQLVVPMDGDWEQTHPDVREMRMVDPEPGVYEVWEPADSYDVDGWVPTTVWRTAEPVRTSEWYSQSAGYTTLTVTVAHVVPADDVFWDPPHVTPEPQPPKWWCIGDRWHLPTDQRHPALDAAPYVGLIETTDD